MKLAGTDEETIYQLATELLINRGKYEKMANAANPYGDGNASSRIADAILYHFGQLKNRPVSFRIENNKA